MRIVITGGHHTSALPVAQKLKEKDPNVEILWVGHKQTLQGDKNPTLEYREITSLDIPFYDLKAGKLYKTGIFQWLKIPLGVIKAIYYLLKVKPGLILSFGGYVAAPVVLAGWFLKIPSITHEQTVVAGYANKFISKLAKKVLVSWRSSENKFPRKKVVYTGLPIRKEVFRYDSPSFESPNNLPTIYITAGKTGSHIINEIVKESLSDLLSFCNIIHQCGDNSVHNDFDVLQSAYTGVKSFAEGKYYLRKFVLKDEIGKAYKKADLVVSRSGAHTVYEILSLKKPSILIPIPLVSHNEQYKNAEIIKRVGIGKILDQGGLTSNTFVQEIKDSLKNLECYSIKNGGYGNLVVKNSADLIVNEILQISK